MTAHLYEGAHLKADRGFHRHHAIFIGSGKVIAYTLEQGITQCSLAEFAQGAQVYLVEHRDALYSGSEVVERAISRLGGVDYNQGMNSSEYFANWCITGKNISSAVSDIPLTTSELVAAMPFEEFARVQQGHAPYDLASQFESGRGAGAGAGTGANANANAQHGYSYANTASSSSSRADRDSGSNDSTSTSTVESLDASTVIGTVALGLLAAGAATYALSNSDSIGEAIGDAAEGVLDTVGEVLGSLFD